MLRVLERLQRRKHPSRVLALLAHVLQSGEVFFVVQANVLWKITETRRCTLPALCTLAALIALDRWQCVDKLRTSTCPDCRKPFSRDDGTRFNISLLHVIDALSEDAGDNKIFLCEKHGSALKSYFCLECREECCADCVISGAHREHTKSVKRCDKLEGAELERINQAAQTLVRSSCDLEDKLQVA